MFLRQRRFRIEPMRSPLQLRGGSSPGRVIWPPKTALKARRLPLLVIGILSLQVLSAHAQAMRTYVSGTGVDSNPCTFAAPCQTLQAALTKTAPGGEIQSLDSADYGHVTINQAVTI